MGRKPLLILVAALAAAAFIGSAGFVAGLMVERLWLAPRRTVVEALTGQAVAVQTTDNRREAFLNYLDGKSIDLKPAQGAADEHAAPHVLRKDEIKAVEFPMTMAKTTGEPWRPEVMMILDVGNDRYFLRCRVPYHELEGTFAFLGFEVLEVSRQ